MKSDTPRTDEFEALRDAMSTRASADYFSALQLCDELERELTAVTKQRDRLAEALKELRNNESMSLGGAAYEIVEQALQSLTTNAEVSFCSASSEIP